MSCYNTILKRDSIKNDIIDKLRYFEDNKELKTVKRGFYISGEPGIGKTRFVISLLKELDYDVLHYTAADVRNKAMIEKLATQNMSSTNVVSMFYKKKRRLAIVMDEIDGLNNGDKGGISSLISIIRPKKTKKQMSEIISNNPIFCISTNEVDKKIKELINVTHYYVFKPPTEKEMREIIVNTFIGVDEKCIDHIIGTTQYDLNKISSMKRLYEKDHTAFKKILENNTFSKKSVTELSKDVVKTFLKNDIPMNLYQNHMSENDRTIIALLWHENVCDILENIQNTDNLSTYGKILDNLCFGDYVDRVTFQKQIWQFNELSSYIKVMYNNYIIHNIYKQLNHNGLKDIRFTKVLTKYSTEYNNYTFFQGIANTLMIGKKDIVTYFDYVQKYNFEDIVTFTTSITPQDIQRIYRYLQNY